MTTDVNPRPPKTIDDDRIRRFDPYHNSPAALAWRAACAAELLSSAQSSMTNHVTMQDLSLKPGPA